MSTNEVLLILCMVCFTSFSFLQIGSVWLFFKSAFLNRALLFPYCFYSFFYLFMQFKRMNFNLIQLVLLPQVLWSSNSLPLPSSVKRSLLPQFLQLLWKTEPLSVDSEFKLSQKRSDGLSLFGTVFTPPRSPGQS